MKECSAKSGNNILIQYKKIGAVLKDPVTVKSIADLNTKNKKMQLLKSIIQTQNTFLNFVLRKVRLLFNKKCPKYGIVSYKELNVRKKIAIVVWDMSQTGG